MNHKSTPEVVGQERSQILDILRGIAVLGICIANYPMFSLYIFQPPDVLMAMPTATIDNGVAYFHFAFIDGKFYSLFALLFGIGFSIIIMRCQQAGKNGLAIFYRRIFILILFGLAHLLLLWEGDILLLYGLIGLLLPLFRNVSDRNLLIIVVCLILSPILIDLIKVLTNNKINAGRLLEGAAIAADNARGITAQNFGTWVLDHPAYSDLLSFNQSGILWRFQTLLDNNRIPKVLGMFLLGLYAGRKMMYAKLTENAALLKKVCRWGYLIGLPLSIAHAWVELNGKKLPHAAGMLNTITYALSVVPLSLAYVASICLFFIKNPGNKLLHLFAAPGRMALSNYILQTIIGISIFYGIGLGLGAKTGVIYAVLIAIVVFIFEIIWSQLWLKYFKYGPLEWIWRMFTYGKYLPVKK